MPLHVVNASNRSRILRNKFSDILCENPSSRSQPMNEPQIHFIFPCNGLRERAGNDSFTGAAYLLPLLMLSLSLGLLRLFLWSGRGGRGGWCGWVGAVYGGRGGEYRLTGEKRVNG